MKLLLRRLLLIALFSALVAAAWLMHRPAHWAPLQAQGEKASPLGVLDQMNQAAIKRSAPFEVTEYRLNEYLQQTTQAQLAASFPPTMKAQAPQLALLEGGAELRLRWDWAGRHVTDLTVQLKLERREDRFVLEVTEGAYGRLNVPRGLLRPVRGLLESMAAAYADEIQALFKMNGIQIQQDRLVLDPRF